MKKKNKSFVTIFMIFEMIMGNLAPVVSLARNENSKVNDTDLKNTVTVTDQSLADCRRLLEGEAYYTLPLAEKEPVDLVVIQDASGSFEENFPKLKEAIKELLPEMPSQDRVMLTSYQGGQFYQLANGKVIDNSPGDSPINIKTVTPLTDDKEVFMDGYNSIRPKGTTPTALGLQEALNSYNKAHGDLSKRKTYFLLITDGVANVQLDGKIHKLNNALLEYPAGMFGGTSVEYSSDYKSAAAEVLDLNQQIKSQGYTMINAFWESVNHLSASNSYYDRYKEIGPYVKEELEKGASSPEDFIVGNTIDDFKNQVKELLEQKIHQMPDATSSLLINDKFDIQSVSATDQDGKQLDTKVNGQTIKVVTPGTYTGSVKIKYQLKENAPIDTETIVSSGNLVQGESKVEFPEALIEANEHAHDCDIKPVNPTIEKDIEGKNHLELTNRTDEFEWHINAQFGNETSQWTQAALVDQVNDLLTIKDVKVVDETGKDVSGNGRLTTEKNKVQFTLAKKDGSYSYLSGHTYTMTIKTTISEEATEEALAAYSKENGIPNQADLVFGDEGESIHSEKPTVTPPPVNPTIEKDIEGKEHLELTNRTDEFEWHINAQFGNETSQWTQAALVDQVNDLLTIKDVKVVDETGKDV
ncbi:fimbrial isopeptide formation D2 family protein, partial [Enterococcus ureilyticus]